MSVTADLMDVKNRPRHIHDYGDQALLLEFDSTAEVLAWAAALREAELLGVLDIVPASRTVLIKLAGPRYQAPTRQRLGKLQRDGRRRCRRRPHPATGAPTSRSMWCTTAPTSTRWPGSPE